MRPEGNLSSTTQTTPLLHTELLPATAPLPAATNQFVCQCMNSLTRKSESETA